MKSRMMGVFTLPVLLLMSQLALGGPAIMMTDNPGGDAIGKGGCVGPDNSIYTVGGFRVHYANNTLDFAVTKHTPDGIVDASFGSNGLVLTSIPGEDMALTAEAQPDGKILVAGYSGKSKGTKYTQSIAIVRYLPNGQLDRSFSGDGKLSKSFGNNTISSIRDIVLQPDGKIVIVGYKLNGGIIIGRLTEGGTWDTSFSGDGWEVSSKGSEARAVAIAPDGKIVAVGHKPDPNNGSWVDVAVYRLNTDGSWDSTFGDDGVVLTDLSPGFNAFGGVTVLSDGRILASGVAGGDFMLVRYLSDGTVDTTFQGWGTPYSPLRGIPGVAYNPATNIQPQEKKACMKVQPDGKILVAGYMYSNPYESSEGFKGPFLTMRFNPDGSMDDTFGTTGVQVVYPARPDLGVYGRESTCGGIDLQSDGRIVLFGKTEPYGEQDYPDFVATRLNADGSLDDNNAGYRDTIHVWLRIFPQEDGEQIRHFRVTVMDEYGFGVEGLGPEHFHDRAKYVDDPFWHDDVYVHYLPVPGLPGVYDGFADFGIYATSNFAYDVQVLRQVYPLASHPDAGYLLHFSHVNETPTVLLFGGLDKDVYNLAVGEDNAVITLRVTDETGAAIENLESSAFETTLDTFTEEVTYVEVSPGLYEGDLSLVGLTLGFHDVDVVVTDTRGVSVSGSDSFEIIDEIPTTPMVHVASISYRDNGRDLWVAIVVEDDLGVKVPDASVDITLYKDGGVTGTYSGTTDADGFVEFKKRKARTGDFSTVVTDIVRPGYEWDFLGDAPDPGYSM